MRVDTQLERFKLNELSKVLIWHFDENAHQTLAGRRESQLFRCARTQLPLWPEHRRRAIVFIFFRLSFRINVAAIETEISQR